MSQRRIFSSSEGSRTRRALATEAKAFLFHRFAYTDVPTRSAIAPTASAMTAQTEHSKRRRRRGRRRLDLSRSGHSSSRGGRAAVAAVAAAKSLGGTTPMCTPRETENSPWLVDPRSLLAVTGIFTIDSHVEYRRNIRHTWVRRTLSPPSQAHPLSTP